MTTPPSSPVHVEAPGIVLRAYRPDDVADLEAAFADEAIALWNPGAYGPDAVERFMSSRNDWSDADHASWAVADPTDRLVGSVSVYKVDRDQGDAEIGYWVAPWARRQGYAVRAVGAASRFAFGRLGMRRLYLFHAVENAGSCAVALAAGFRHEGTMRESYRYADGVHHDEHLHGLLARDLGPETDR
ncbi:GNAT family N-acetyltransferase [Ornithinimicrobium sp. W1679]|uniref:GNAT family N-acetyltransferase n=1 Tax=Ornithinimicrobium sp. W1679 TaxID=3418770 RepID=UPI003CFA399E